MTDQEREQLIEKFRRRVVSASTREAKKGYAELMRVLIAERSPQQVEQMERSRGLR